MRGRLALRKLRLAATEANANPLAGNAAGISLAKALDAVKAGPRQKAREWTEGVYYACAETGEQDHEGFFKDRNWSLGGFFQHCRAEPSARGNAMKIALRCSSLPGCTYNICTLW